MAGTLQVNEHSTWTPSGWIFNNLLERVSDRLAQSDPELAQSVSDALGRVPGHLDLSLLTADRFQLFAQAADEVARRLRSAGPEAFPDPSYFQRYTTQLDQLLRLLHADPRSGSA